MSNPAAHEIGDGVGGDGDVGGVLGGVPAEVLDAFDDDLYVIKLVDGP